MASTQQAALPASGRPGRWAARTSPPRRRCTPVGDGQAHGGVGRGWRDPAALPCLVASLACSVVPGPGRDQRQSPPPNTNPHAHAQHEKQRQHGQPPTPRGYHCATPHTSLSVAMLLADPGRALRSTEEKKPVRSRGWGVSSVLPALSTAKRTCFWGVSGLTYGAPQPQRGFCGSWRADGSSWDMVWLDSAPPAGTHPNHWRLGLPPPPI